MPTNFLPRPSSRPTSPCGKRRHSGTDRHARSPSPHHSPTPGASPLGSVTDDTWAGSPGGALGSLLMSGYQELDVPSKTRRTLGAQLGLLAGQGDPGLEPLLDSPGVEAQEPDDLADLFLQVPSHFSWNKPKPGNPPLFRNSSPPPLDWPLPDHYDQCELKVEVQPRSYHRAHYETEGSRGSIKAATSGHPVVKLIGPGEQPLNLLLFIGTADERFLRPHSFYQAHRVTGKTVTTACHERIMGGTKVLEIPLLPENNMAASIDCAGILKLRNADIELKKGEMDVGRKNTRVRVVFRVGLPQPDNQALWLQTASSPVECSQRSGQELPVVESFSPPSCSADGGEELLISGFNISAQSRAVFMEKGPDGRSLWEAEARVVPEKSGASSIVVEVPRYNKKTTDPVQVQFYVSNGKRRRSLTQSFTFLPGVRRCPPPTGGVKQERWDPSHISHNPPGFDVVYYDPCDLPVHCRPSFQTLPRQHHPSPPSVFPQSFSQPPQTSSVPLQTFTSPHQTSSGEPQKENPPKTPSLSSRKVFVTPSNPRNESFPDSGGAAGVKQEPDQCPVLGSLGLQEITLDDVSEIIGRDIGVQLDHVDRCHQYDWEHEPPA